jgi:hypothetical protein
MDARAEAIAIQRERMCPPAGTIMLFQDQDLFACLGERNGGSEAACAGANDDHIIRWHVYSSLPSIICAWSGRAETLTQSVKVR